MNKHILSMALLLWGLASCNNEEIITRGTEVVPDGYAGISLKLASTKDAGTRAVGDTLNVLTPEEKKIESIAFFVENVDGFKSYFSDEPLHGTRGLETELTKQDDVTYSASIRIPGDEFGASEVVLIANYAENGLATDLKALTSMAGLKAKTLTITDNAATPLLMYSSKNVTLKNGERLDASFDMNRIAARIDIVNLAKGVASADGFELTSARLVNAKTQSFFWDKATVADVEALPVDAAKTFSLRTVNATDPTKIDTLYTYANPNSTPATATAVELVGTFKNAPVVKLVKFEKFDATLNKYVPIAIDRNYRYLVQITPAKEEHDVNLTIKVLDWAAADTFKTEAVNKAPVATYVANTGGAAWKTSLGGKAVKTLDIATTAQIAAEQTLIFSTTENQECEVEVERHGNWQGANITVDKVITYGAATDPASKVKTEFTVTIPAYNVAADGYIGLRRALLKIKNRVDETLYDSIQILQRIPYVASNAPAAVLVNGIWWAPMNCGATTYDISTTVTAGDLTAKHGKLYQWGRKYGFDNNTTTLSLATAWPTQADLEGMEADSKWTNKFIPSTTSSFNSRNNWLRINPAGDNPAAADMEADAWYQRLWNENEVAGTTTVVKKSASDPCPEGWRVPTTEEWKLLSTGGNWDANAKFFSFSADANDLSLKLALPAAGYRKIADGAIGGQASNGDYWASSAPAKNINASYAYFNTTTLSLKEDSRAYGLSIRCVQE